MVASFIARSILILALTVSVFAFLANQITLFCAEYGASGIIILVVLAFFAIITVEAPTDSDEVSE